MRSLALKWLCVQLLGCSLTAQAATYTVPSGDYIADDIVLPLDEVKYSRVADSIQLKYALPGELDGLNAQEFSLTGADTGTNFVLNGPNVAADCSRLDATTRCMVRYSQLQLNTEAADQYLMANTPDLSQRLLLQNARMQLEHQAVGIVTIRSECHSNRHVRRQR